MQESTLGAFQRHETVELGSALSHPTVYACVTQIAYDIGKLGLSLTQKDSNGIHKPIDNKKISRLLRKPNQYQIRQKFIESWQISLHMYGNTYALKGRDATGSVTELHILDYNKVEPLVSEDGRVFYGVKKDSLPGIYKDIEAIPAYEIIHDTMITLFHPLIGVPPIYAGSLSIQQGLSIQDYSANFFENKAQPGGILTAPGSISREKGDQIRDAWQSRFSGDNAGKIAVLGDGLKYEAMAQTAEDSQLIDQLKWSDEKICSVFKVPPYKVHVGKMPTYQESETLDRKYYSDCLQSRIESIEALLNEGLSLPDNQSMMFNLDDLMRMDFYLKMKTYGQGVKDGILAPDEARFKINHGPVKGGHTPYMQQQNYSLAALDERDKTNPLAVQVPPPAPEPEPDETDKFLYELIKKDIPGVYCA